MARIFQSGFETPPYFHPWMQHNAFTSRSISSTKKRSGGYALAGTKNNSSGESFLNILDETVQTSEMWFRVAWCPEVVHSSGYHAHLIYDDADSNIAEIRYYPNGYFTTLIKGANSVDWTPPAPLIGTRFYCLEIHVLEDAVSGKVEFKFEGNLFRTFSGDTKGSGTKLAKMGYRLQISQTGSTSAYWDDWAINNSQGEINNGWCGDGYIIPIRPNANGDASQWTDQADSQLNNYQAVDEVSSDSDTTYVKASETGKKDLYNLENISLPTGSVIRTVQPIAASRTVTAEGDAIKVGLKSGGVEDFRGAQTLTTEYLAYVGKIYEKAPDTTSWSETNVNALQVGIESA